MHKVLVNHLFNLAKEKVGLGELTIRPGVIVMNYIFKVMESNL